MKRPRLFLIGLLLAPLASQWAVAQTLDPTFAPSSVFAPGTVYSVAEQPDGKRVVAGVFSRINGTASSSVARFEPAGALDAAFQQNVGAAAGAYRPRLLANGQILVISIGSQIRAGGLTRQSVLRLNADGTGDAAFDAGTGATSAGNPIFVDDLLLLPNGQSVVVGPFTQFNGAAVNRIVRLTTTGAVDPAFNSGTGADQEIEIITGLPNGQMLIGGYFTSYNGNPCNGLARLNADGSFDPSFGQVLSTDSEVLNIALQSDGKIVVAGGLNFTFNNGQGLARLLPTGALDPAFFPPPGLDAYDVFSYFGDAVQLQPDGKILINSSPAAAGTMIPGVSRLNADGSVDPSFQAGVGPGNSPFSLTLLADGQVLAGGNFTNFNGLADRPLVQLSGAGAVVSTFQPVIQSTGTVNAVVRQADGKLVVGGNFSEINGQLVRRLARFNATGGLDATFAAPTTINAPVTDLALQPDGRILATGNTVLRFLSTGALDNNFTAPSFSGRPTRLLLQPDGRILVGGGGVGGANADVVRLLPTGAVDGTFALNTTGPTRVSFFQSFALQPNGKVLVAAAYTPNNATTRVPTVVRLENTGAVDASFFNGVFDNASFFGGLNSLAVQPDGKVLVGGRFTGYDGTPRANLARLNADGTLDAAFTPPALAGVVNKVLFQPNNRILLGGAFTGTGLPANLARLLPTGQADATFGATAVPNSNVGALLVQPDGNIVLGGSFTTLSGQASPALARVTATNVLQVTAPRAVAERTEAWPVPAHGILQVAPASGARAQFLDLLDALGRPVLHQVFTGAATTAVPVGTLAPGTYLLRVTYAEELVMRRIQVQ